MADHNTHLSGFLKRPNPKICSLHSWEGGNTKSKKGKWSEPEGIRPWKGFKPESLTKQFREKLEMDVTNEILPHYDEDLSFHLMEIRDEDFLEALLIRWTQAVVSRALAVAQRDTAANSDQIFMARGGQGWIDTSRIRVRPDWAGIQTDKIKELKVNHQKRTMYRNVLPGDTKLSSKWGTKVYEENKMDSSYSEPFRRIFTYCEEANIRYGYLITQKELVVIRLVYEERTNGPDAPDKPDSAPSLLREQSKRDAKASVPPDARKRKSSEPKLILEYQSIDWEDELHHDKRTKERKEPETLTINLALWCLRLMAKNEKPLVLPEEGEDNENDYAQKRRKTADSSFRSETSAKTAESGSTRKRRRETGSSDVTLPDP